MNKIVGIFENKEQADRVLEALEELGIEQDAMSIFSRNRVEVEQLEGESTEEIMVTAYAKQEKFDEIETIFKNSDANQVNVWGEDWKPQSTWSPIVYGRTSN